LQNPLSSFQSSLLLAVGLIYAAHWNSMFVQLNRPTGRFIIRISQMEEENNSVV
jgi:hypothetical protein